MVLARIFCPILTHNPPEVYMVWTSDRETREVSSSLLHRIMVTSSGDEDVDGDGRGLLPLPTTTPPMHAPSQQSYPQGTHITHTSSQSSHDNHSQPYGSRPRRPDPQDLNTLSTRAPTVDGIEGKRWLLQANTDFLACRILCDSVDRYPEVCCSVCFMAHEAAEKALKAGRYVTCGMTDPTELIHHQLSHHAYALVSLLPGMTGHLHEYASYLEPFYLKTRFPNQYGHNIVPFQKFTRDDAICAKDAAEQIWRMMYDIFQHFKVPVELLRPTL